MKVGFDNQALPENTDDHRSNQIHLLRGCHPAHRPVAANRITSNMAHSKASRASMLLSQFQ